MRSGVVLTFGLALTVLAGCEKASPPSPAGPVVGDQGGNGGAAGPTATLVLTDLSVKESRYQPFDTPVWGYDPRFRIIETSGRAGAVITKVRVATPFWVAPPDNIWDETGDSCWRSPVRVEAGGTLDAFFVDGGGLGYCAPSLTSLQAQGLPSVVVTITYRDDYLAIGELVATIPVPPRPH